MSTRKSRIRVFDTFTKALNLLEEEDRQLYSWPRNRLALSHALAEHLHDLVVKLDPKLSVDLCPSFTRSSKAINPDILVHNRATGVQLLSIVCRNEYITEAEQADLIKYRKESKCELILALSFMAQRNYMLVYVAGEDRIEYYHFDRNFRTLEPVRKKSLEDQKESKDQLTLYKMLKKH